MNSSDLKQLYNAVIMKHQKDPYHFEEKDGEPSFIASNPMCGDTFKVYLQEQGDQIMDVHYHGFGCALSKASASILLKAIENKTRDEVREFCSDFLAAAEGRKKWQYSDETDMLAELRNHGGRMDCIKLVWKGLNDYLEEKEI